MICRFHIAFLALVLVLAGCTDYAANYEERVGERFERADDDGISSSREVVFDYSSSERNGSLENRSSSRQVSSSSSYSSSALSSEALPVESSSESSAESSAGSSAESSDEETTESSAESSTGSSAEDASSCSSATSETLSSSATSETSSSSSSLEEKNSSSSQVVVQSSSSRQEPVVSSSSKVVVYCGSEVLDESRYFCDSNLEIQKLCRGSSYDVDEYFCYNNTLYELCDGKTYSPDAQTCSNGIILGSYGGYQTVTVAGVSWMTTNASGSSVYTWSDAASKCPSGFRLPTNAEFKSLKSNMNSSIIKFFNQVLPGYYDFSGKMIGVDKSVYYWTSTLYDDYDGEFAYAYYLSSATSTNFSSGYKAITLGYSVRCVR